jgi:hypothetical protein
MLAEQQRCAGNAYTMLAEQQRYAGQMLYVQVHQYTCAHYMYVTSSDTDELWRTIALRKSIVLFPKSRRYGSKAFRMISIACMLARRAIAIYV